MYFSEETIDVLPNEIGFASMDAKSADLDNDKNLDLVDALEFDRNITLTNDDRGNFNLEEDSLSKNRYYSEEVVINNFNCDGFLELIFVSEDDKTNEYYLNTDSTKFQDLSNRFPVTGILDAAVSVDLNNDGVNDLYLSNRISQNDFGGKDRLFFGRLTELK
ncbi:MAG: FG-GAP-like repeat-containing protein [Proteobacteria bacterium]|nr:FG-GAP-like repeat-containing protein [Pseudomonadota bacterium]